MTDEKEELKAELSALCKAFASLSDEREVLEFFEDIFTQNELRALSQRWNVALRLRDGQSFSRISSETGASTATISRVSRCLSGGSGGYRRVLAKLDKNSGGNA